MDLIWEKTDKGYAATGDATNYEINRTPGHRYWLCVDGVEIRQGKVPDLKNVAQANENAGTGGKSGKAAPTPKPVVEPPATRVVPAAEIRAAHAAAVDATTPDAFPPVRKSQSVVVNHCEPNYTCRKCGQVGYQMGGLPVCGGCGAKADLNTIRERASSSAPALYMIDPQLANPPRPDSYPDGDDSDVGTPVVPNIPDTESPAGTGGGTRMHRFHTRSPTNVFRPFLRPPPQIVGQDGRPIRAWLSR